MQNSNIQNKQNISVAEEMVGTEKIQQSFCLLSCCQRPPGLQCENSLKVLYSSGTIHMVSNFLSIYEIVEFSDRFISLTIFYFQVLASLHLSSSQFQLVVLLVLWCFYNMMYAAWQDFKIFVFLGKLLYTDKRETEATFLNTPQGQNLSKHNVSAATCKFSFPSMDQWVNCLFPYILSQLF